MSKYKTNKRDIKISASMACANFACLGKDIRDLEEAGVSMLHFDIADGSFADTFIMGPCIIENIRHLTKLPFDAHLAVWHPYEFVEQFVEAGCEYISVHVEAADDIKKVLRRINDLGSKSILSLCPETPIGKIEEEILYMVDMVLILSVHPGYAGQAFIPSTIDKIRQLSNLLERRGLSHLDIAVDGNINPTTIPLVVKAGANVLIGGSSGLFIRGKMIKDCARGMMETAHRSLQEKKG